MRVRLGAATLVVLAFGIFIAAPSAQQALSPWPVNGAPLAAAPRDELPVNPVNVPIPVRHPQPGPA